VAAGICCGAKLGTVGAAVGSADVPQATASTVNNIAATASQPVRFSKASGWLVILSNSWFGNIGNRDITTHYE
jgi:hypothetical protein